MEEKKVLLNLRHVDVKFNVRGRILTAIRDVTLQVYENESLAIVGESGSGKSVLTKTFAGMLDSNGFISHGTIIFKDDEISKTSVEMDKINTLIYQKILKKINLYSTYERGGAEYKAIEKLKEEILQAQSLSAEELEKYAETNKEISDELIDLRNYMDTLSRRDEHDALELEESQECFKELIAQQQELEKERDEKVAKRKADYEANTQLKAEHQQRLHELEEARRLKIAGDGLEDNGNPYMLSDTIIKRNDLWAKEVVLSIGRYPIYTKIRFYFKLSKAFKEALTKGTDFSKEKRVNRIFENATFRVQYQGCSEDGKTLHGYAIIDCAKIKYAKDWQRIRGRRIATIFQDPMTSLNPVIPIGKQIITIILKHQKCGYSEAKQRALEIMQDVGIPDPKGRFNDYPFQYSGGMRQRIVIAIALSCQPKILICDEPTTALDVTIQAQIIRLIKDLQKKFGFTTVYITHDLGVVANVAERVAVLYAGQIVEIGSVEDIFYNPKHPYTWALLSSLPQLSERGKELYSIPGTPPSLYNKIVGDAFALRSQYAMAIDLVKEAPMMEVSEGHFAKTWLLDPRAPKVEAPENIQNLHEKMLKVHASFEDEEAL